MDPLDFDRRFDARPGRVERLSPLVRRVLCGNPGPFTFTGTSTYIVGNGHAAVIDPGPADEAHLAALLAALEGETVTHILVTHSHADHAALAGRLKSATGAATYGHAGAGMDHSLDHGEAIEGRGWSLAALHTPGHMADHLCFALDEEKALFTGDHVMAWSTSVIAPPEGHMGDYFQSLRLLLERDDDVYWPAHGPGRRDPKPLVRGLLAHRKMREDMILGRIKSGDGGIAAIVAAVYPKLDPALRAAAALSVRAHVEHLMERGLVCPRVGLYVATGTGETRLC